MSHILHKKEVNGQRIFRKECPGICPKRNVKHLRYLRTVILSEFKDRASIGSSVVAFLC